MTSIKSIWGEIFLNDDEIDIFTLYRWKESGDFFFSRPLDPYVLYIELLFYK